MTLHKSLSIPSSIQSRLTLPLLLKPHLHQVCLRTYKNHNLYPHQRRFKMGDAAGRNPHPDFKTVEASRPDAKTNQKVLFTKTPQPNWKWGDGPNHAEPKTASHSKKHISIDPHEEGRPANFNYKLLISAIVPRPIAFVSTLSAEGVPNLAPFSFFNLVQHDPPMFTVGISGVKDTINIVRDTKEVTINIISESFLEAANASSVAAPEDVSEWVLSGLTPVHDTEVVKPARVKEAIVSIEAKLHMMTEFDSKAKPGTKSGTLCIFEGVRFWVREDALNEQKNLVDLDVSASLTAGGVLFLVFVLGVVCILTNILFLLGSQTHGSSWRHHLRKDHGSYRVAQIRLGERRRRTGRL